MDNEQKTWKAMVDGFSIDSNDSDFWDAEFAAAPTEELSAEAVKRTTELAVSGELGNWDSVEMTGEHLDVENAIFNTKENDSLSREEQKRLIDQLKNLRKGIGDQDHSGKTMDGDPIDGST